MGFSPLDFYIWRHEITKVIPFALKHPWMVRILLKIDFSSCANIPCQQEKQVLFSFKKSWMATSASFCPTGTPNGCWGERGVFLSITVASRINSGLNLMACRSFSLFESLNLPFWMYYPYSWISAGGYHRKTLIIWGNAKKEILTFFKYSVTYIDY